MQINDYNPLKSTKDFVGELKVHHVTVAIQQVVENLVEDQDLKRIRAAKKLWSSEPKEKRIDKNNWYHIRLI